MPYAPGVKDISGQLMAAGISQAGDAIGGALQDFATAQYESDYLRASLDGFRETNPDLVTAETLEKFDSGSLGAKRAMVSQIAATANRNQEMELQREKMAMSAQAARDRHNLSIALAQFKHDLDVNAPPVMPIETEFGGRAALVNPRTGGATFLPEESVPASPALFPLGDSGYNAVMVGDQYKGMVGPPKVEEPAQAGPPAPPVVNTLPDGTKVLMDSDGSVRAYKFGEPEDDDPYGPTSEDDDLAAWIKGQ